MANKITTILDLDDRGFKKSIGNVRRSIADADGGINKMKAGWKSAGAAAKAYSTEIAAAGVAFAVAFGAKAVRAASDLEQSVGGVEKGFGSAADAILAIGENADEAMGLSQRAFNEGALALSAFAEDIAKDTGEPVEKVITDLMTRAADFAAAYGTTVPEAVRIFSSTLSGESEPIKRFGIIVNETETKAYAAEAGMDGMGKATQRAGLLMRDTSKFAGQFAEESDTLAGQQERLSAEFENMQAEIGEGLLPIVADAVVVIRALGDAYKFLDEQSGYAIDNQIDRIPFLGKAVNAAIGPMVNPLKAASDGFAGLEEALGGASDAAEEYSDKIGAGATASGRHQSRIYDMTLEVQRSTDAAEDAADAADVHSEALERVAKTADIASRKIDKTKDAFENMRRELSDRSSYLTAQDGIAALATQAEKTGDVTELQIIRMQQDVLDYGATLTTEADKERIAEIQTKLNEEDYWAAALQLEALEKTRTARVNIRTTVIGSQGGRSFDFFDDQAARGKGATGGIVTQPTKALIGEAGPEAVIPLNQMPGASPLPSGMGGTSGPNVNVTVHALDPQAAANAVAEALKVWERRNGRRL